MIATLRLPYSSVSSAKNGDMQLKEPGYEQQTLQQHVLQTKTWHHQLAAIEQYLGHFSNWLKHAPTS
jgi:hypothetical protein